MLGDKIEAVVGGRLRPAWELVSDSVGHRERSISCDCTHPADARGNVRCDCQDSTL